jgi:glycosyltransferase involved in cell wall biosynthesis
VLPLLEARGWRFVFWTPPGPLADELAGRGYDVAGEQRLLRYSRSALTVPPGPVARLRSVPGYLSRFRRWVKAQSPDVVQANTLITIPEALAARTAGVPVVMYVHEILPDDLRGAVAARLIRAVAHEVVTNSRSSERALGGRGVRARMVHQGVEPPPEPPPPPDSGPLVIGTLGTISRRKGSDVFLEAARRVREALPNTDFRMVGPRPEGSESAWADAIVRRAETEGVSWSVTDDPFREVAGWHLLVLPSRLEPFGLVLIEAMAMGRPVVSTAIDGPAEIVTPETGLLVPVDDPDALANAILDLAADAPRRAAMGAAGRRRVEQHFSLDAQAEVVHGAYSSAVG